MYRPLKRGKTTREVNIDPTTAEGAFLSENPYALAAVRIQDDDEVNAVQAALCGAYASLAVAYEARQSRFELEERLRSMEQLVRDGKGW